MQVYRILNLKNNKCYIGKTVYDFKRRYRGGKWWKTSHSEPLKNSVKKWGLDCFSCEILWEGECSEEALIELEGELIERYDCLVPRGYNILKKDGKKADFFCKEYIFVNEFGDTVKVENLSKFCFDNGLNYSAMLNLACGISKESQGFAIFGGQTKRKTNKEYSLFNNKTKEINAVKYKDIPKWCKEKNVSLGGIRAVLSGKNFLSNGWSILGAERKKKNVYIKYKKGVTLVSPLGEELEIEDVRKFSLENDMKGSSLYNLIRGKSLSCKGWTLPCTKDYKKTKRKRFGRLVKLVSPQGEVFDAQNLSLFCEEHKISRDGINDLVNHHKDSHKGWTLTK